MKLNGFLVSGFSAAIALGLVGFGCSSSNGGGGTGTGGATGTGGHANTDGGVNDAPVGTGGHVNGAGGNGAGGNGAGGAGQDAGSDAPPSCGAATDNGTTCNASPACTKSCGLNVSSLTTGNAQETCTCSGATDAGGHWACPSAAGGCIYPAGLDYTCFSLTPTPALCPRPGADGGADAGGSPIRSGVTTCSPPNSETCGNICGSPTAGVISYLDSTGVGKVGYCVCIVDRYQCAVAAEWPVAP
jgi:hypothetical protein